MPQQTNHIRRNLLALGADYVFFTFGFTFWDPIVVVPSFIQDLTGSTVAVGLLTAVRVLFITLPQLWAASYLVSRPLKKPLLVWSCVGGRLPLAILSIATLVWAGNAVWAVSLALALTFAAFFASEGLNGISWPDLVGKLVPQRIRGRFLGYGQLFSSLGALGAGLLVRAILGANGLAYPANWAVLFACAFGGMMLSLGGILFTREEADVSAAAVIVDVRRDFRAIFSAIRRDDSLWRLIAVQLLLGLAGATFPFFVIRARQVLTSGDEIIGLFLIAQNVGGMSSALVLGNLIDRYGAWLSLRVLAGTQVVCLAGLTAGSLLGWYWPAYLAAFMLLGFLYGGAWWCYTSYILEMASERERPLYLAATGMLQSLNAFSATLVGVLLSILAAEMLYAAAAVISLGAVLLAFTLPKLRPHTQPVNQPSAEV